MDLSGFSQKLQRLIKEHEQVKKENEKLKAELTASQAGVQLFEEQITLLKTQVSAMQASGKTLGGKYKEEMENRINKYVKEIDKAIILLNG